MMGRVLSAAIRSYCQTNNLSVLNYASRILILSLIMNCIGV